MREYFVVNDEKKQGKWQSEVVVDLPPFISYRFQKARSHREKYDEAQKKKRAEVAKKAAKAKQADEEKRKAETAQKQAELEKRKAEEAKKRAEVVKKAAEAKQAEAQQRQEELFKRIAQVDGKPKAESAKVAAMPAVKTPKKPAAKKVTKPRTIPAILPHVFQSTLMVHRETTYKLLEESAARGEATVSVLAMTTARNAALNSLRNTNEMLRQNISMDELKRNMAVAESDAVRQFVQSRGGKK
jgi:hypothetical protein